MPVDSVPFNTPVLLIIFNRPETTRAVFNSIRNIRPSRLYIAADGPRPYNRNDLAKCAETRLIVSEIDWKCDLKTLFRDQNLNCGLGPSSAMSWFFEHEEEGIILEDDCLPTKSFFYYCQELLARYRSDSRIMHIGGNNFLNTDNRESKFSYYFSLNGHVWGWASWRRAWKSFDFRMEHYDLFKRTGYFNSLFPNLLERIYRMRKLDQAAGGKMACWDYQWDFARWINSGLAIVPVKNLVRNIGFGSDATHTNGNMDTYLDMESHEMDFPIRHPSFVLHDFEMDRKYFAHIVKKKVFRGLKRPFNEKIPT